MTTQPLPQPRRGQYKTFKEYEAAVDRYNFEIETRGMTPEQKMQWQMEKQRRQSRQNTRTIVWALVIIFVILPLVIALMMAFTGAMASQYGV